MTGGCDSQAPNRAVSEDSSDFFWRHFEPTAVGCVATSLWVRSSRPSHDAHVNSRVVLVHSPLTGPAVWSWVAMAMERRGIDVIVPSLHAASGPEPRSWRACVRSVVDVLDRRDDHVLVAHSGAGPLLPQIAEDIAPRACVFVDARLPAPAGEHATLEGRLSRMLEALAHDGVLPPWSTWWGPEALAQLVPDPERRRVIEAELPSLPLAFVTEAIPTPAAWTDRGAFLRFSDAYRAEAQEAARRGWVVEELEGTHLAMAVEPEAVTDRLLDLAARTS